MPKDFIFSDAPAQPPPLNRPVIDERRVRASVANGESASDLAYAARAEYEQLNGGVHSAQAQIEVADKQAAYLDERRGSLIRKITRTHAHKVIITADRVAQLPLLTVVDSLLMILLACAALLMGNRVGAAYVVRSGNDLYAADPLGASLFVGVCLLAGGALKVFEYRLATDHSRDVYHHVIAAIAFLAFLIWGGAMAIAFAPEAAGSLNWVAGGPGSHTRVTTALVFAHIIADVACAYVIFVGAERLLLAGRKVKVIDNPYHLALQKLLAESEALLARIFQARGEGEEFLRRYEAGGEAVERQARNAHQRESARLAALRKAAEAQSEAEFLNNESLTEK